LALRDRLKHQVILLFFPQFRPLAAGEVVAQPQMPLVLVEEAAVVVGARLLALQVLEIHRQPSHLKEIMAALALVLAHSVAAAVAALADLARQALQEMVEQPRLLQLLAQQFIMLAAAGECLILRLLPVWVEELQLRPKKVGPETEEAPEVLEPQTPAAAAAADRVCQEGLEELADLAL
jgi:hypothetical protein